MPARVSSRVAAVTDDPGVAAFNGLPEDRALAELAVCNAATGWAAAIEAGRPYADRLAVLAAADRISAGLAVAAVRVALDGHPRIGARADGGEAGSRWSQDEQSGVRREEATLASLERGNRDYEERFGHIYLVCASGLDAEQILADLRARLANDEQTEQRVVAGELAKIATLRLGKLLDEMATGEQA